MDAPGEVGQRPGVALVHQADKLLHIIPGGQAELAGELTVHRVLHHHVQHLTALVHHDLQFPGHGLPRMDAGHGAHQPRPLLGQYVTPGGGGDVQPSRPQESHVPHDDLPADRKFLGQRGGAHRGFGLLQDSGDGFSSVYGVHGRPSCLSGCHDRSVPHPTGSGKVDFPSFFL